MRSPLAPTAVALLLGLLLALLLALPSLASAQMHEEVDESYSGIRVVHRWGFDENGVRQNYYVAFVDLRHPEVSIQVALNRDTWGGAKEPVRGMADRHGAALAVNGDYWAWGLNDPSQGTTAAGGVCYRAHPERSAIAFDESLSRAEIGRFGSWPIPEGPPDDCPEWFHSAIGAGPQFLFDGLLRWEESPNATDPSVPDINGDTFFGAEAWAWDDGRQPNTAAALTEDGSTLILLTCDGRGAGLAGGCRMASDVADLLLSYGAYQAIKLDSGGSTTFYYEGEVLNHVSDNAATAPTERSVVDALLIHAPRRSEGCPLGSTMSPTTIDDGSFCFLRSGRYFWAEEAGEAGLCRYTWGFEGERDSYARWRFSVPIPGVYRVEARIPELEQLSSQAPYFIEGTRAGPAARVLADQAAARGGWLDLGEHDFLGGEGAEVRLEDNTGEPYYGGGDPRDRRVVFDAVRLTPIELSLPRDAGAGAFDGGPGGPDAGPGSRPTEPAGCGCRVGSGPRAGLPGAAPLGLLLGLLVGLLVGLVLARRRSLD